MFTITQRMVTTMAMLAATAGAAMAQSVDPAQVAAEAAAANKAGLVARGEMGAPEAKFVSTRSSAEVRSQAVAAVAAGPVQPQPRRGQGRGGDGGEVGQRAARRSGLIRAASGCGPGRGARPIAPGAAPRHAGLNRPAHPEPQPRHGTDHALRPGPGPGAGAGRGGAAVWLVIAALGAV